MKHFLCWAPRDGPECAVEHPHHDIGARLHRLARRLVVIGPPDGGRPLDEKRDFAQSVIIAQLEDSDLEDQSGPRVQWACHAAGC